MLPRSGRLGKKLVPTVLKRGRAVNTAAGSAKFVSLGTSVPSRFTFVISSKSLKRAVDRNLLKRRARHIVQKHDADIRPGYLIMIFLKPTLLTLPFTSLEKEIVFLLQKAKII